MKKLLALMLVLCLLAGCTAAPTPTAETTAPTQATRPTTEATTAATETTAEVTAQEASSVTPLLYKVSDGTHVIWLFGSIHVGDESYYPLPDYVLSAYEGSDALAVECDVLAAASDVTGQAQAMMPLMYTDGTSIKDHIPSELYEKSVALLDSCGLYSPMMDRFMPALWFMLLESYLMMQTGADTELGIDMYFLTDAHNTGKQILEIESVEFQYRLLAGFSEKLQIFLLEDIVEACADPEAQLDELGQLMQLWAQGDEAAFTAYLTAEEAPTDPEEAALSAEYNKALVTDRNISMADFAEKALQSGEEVFIVVGAAHVVGPGGMADLLAQRGYTVEVVKP